jgi:hypothetical protein
MVQKVVKEVVPEFYTGEYSVEYSDGTGKSFNIDELPVAKVVGGDIVLEVFGETIDVAGSAESAVEQAQAIATVTGEFAVGKTLTVSLPTGWSGSFQWTRDGVNISSANSATYVLDAADEGAVVTCEVSDLVYAAVGNTVVA